MTITSTSLTPHSIFNLFLKYSIEHLPIIHNKEITGYISKGKVLRQANHIDFFKKPLLKQLHHMISHDLPLETFFNELDTHALETIPTIDSKHLTAKIYPEKEFNHLFRPVIRLTDNELGSLFQNLSLPCFILNAKLNLIYANPTAETFKKKAKLILAKHLPKPFKINHPWLDLFSPDVYPILKNPHKDRIHIDLSQYLKITYTCHPNQIRKGLVYVFLIISLFER